MGYTLKQKIQDDTFDPSQLDKYLLLLCLGTQDMQVVVVHTENRRVLLVEDYVLGPVRTVSERLRLVQGLFNRHLFLKGGFWKEVRCMIKTHKFTLIPKKAFHKNAGVQFLELNAKINADYERSYAYLHKKSDIVSVFAADYRLIQYIEEIYAPKKVTFIKQGSAFIEAARQYYARNTEKMLFLLIDRQILHLLVLRMEAEVFYYNQFSIKKEADIYTHLQLTNRVIELDQDRVPIIVGGAHGNTLDPVLQALRKRYEGRLLPAKRMRALHYSDVFDKVPHYAFFDILGGVVCNSQPIYAL